MNQKAVSRDVSVAVKSEANQRAEGRPIVFVQEGETSFEARPVEVGGSDAAWTEVKSGLAAGQRYVARTSFLVKANIGKAGAEHEH